MSRRIGFVSRLFAMKLRYMSATFEEQDLYMRMHATVSVAGISADGTVPLDIVVEVFHKNRSESLGGGPARALSVAYDSQAGLQTGLTKKVCFNGPEYPSTHVPRCTPNARALFHSVAGRHLPPNCVGR